MSERLTSDERLMHGRYAEEFPGRQIVYSLTDVELLVAAHVARATADAEARLAAVRAELSHDALSSSKRIRRALAALNTTPPAPEPAPLPKCGDGFCQVDECQPAPTRWDRA